jgi:branched-chain amino acid transport system permease protein
VNHNIRAIFLLVAVAGALQGLSMGLPLYFQTLLLLVGINALLAVSLNIINGLSGQFSLGHAGFMAVGAYVSSSVDTFLLPSWQATDTGAQAALVVSLLVGALAGALMGFLVGLPALRLRGDYLAIATLGFGEIIRVVLLNIQSVGGARGMIGIPQTTTAFLVFAILGASVLGINRFIHSTHGRALLSVREDEIASSCLGVNTTAYKVGAFTVASALAGVSGGLLAHQMSYINPGMFGFMKSVEVVIMVVLGGLGSISGSIVAAVILTLLPEALRPLQDLTGVDLRMVIYSLALIVMMLMRPEGLFGRKEIWQLAWKRKP